MDPGSVFAQRFVVAARVAASAEAELYRAEDRSGGGWVSLKVVRRAKEGAARERFVRSCELLGRVRHEGVLRYVAHGFEADGTAWVATEWVDGETLAARLGRGTLTPQQAAELGRRLASAVGAAHAMGIVHRDLQPSNVVLPGGDLGRATLVDFAVASIEGGEALTAVNQTLGTPAYMAPELARETKVRPNADVFSIGCILFEALTGAPPFGRGAPLVVMTRLLFEEALPLSVAAPEVPEELAAIIDRTLEKDPALRFENGARLAEALAAFAPKAPRRAAPAEPRDVGRRERQLLSVVLVGRGAGSRGSADFAPIAAEVQARGGRAERMVNGTVVISLGSDASGVDQAAAVARCALAVRRLRPGVPMVLATGRTEGGGAAVREIVERGVAMLEEAPPPGGHPHDAEIAVDELTAGLLDRRFAIRSDGGRFRLVGEADPRQEGRSLRGRALPFVGRRGEIETLLAGYRDVVATRASRVVLVTGAPGMGKSRLLCELVTRLDAIHPTPTAFLGRGDPTKSSVPLSLFASAFADLFGLREGEGEIVSRHRVRSRVSRHVPRDKRERVTALLGELVGVKFDEESYPFLADARSNRTKTADLEREAIQDFLVAELTRGPVVLALDDLQAADAPSITFLDFAMRLFADAPLLVVGFARTEAASQLPEEFGGQPAVVMGIEPLPSKAVSLLVEQVLGPDDPRADSIAELAQGNPFFVEELLRSALDGGGGLPATLLGAIAAQLDTLDAAARRVLRAASVFGERFTRNGLRAVLADAGERDTSHALDALVARELLKRGQRTDAGDEGFAFTSEILRSACYEELTEEDRRGAHRLAAEWLESVAGDESASEVARHYAAGREPRRALAWHLRAGEIALQLGDFAHAIEAAESAVEAGAAGAMLARSRLLQAAASRELGESESTLRYATAAMSLLPQGAPAWWTAAADALDASVRRADTARIEHLARAVAQAAAGLASASASSRVERADAPRASISLLHAGRFAEADAILDATLASAPDARIRGRGWTERALARRAMYRADLATALEHSEAVVKAFLEAGEVREASAELVSLGFLKRELGAYAEAEASLREALAIAERLHLPVVIGDACEQLGTVLMRMGLSEEAERHFARGIERFREQGDRRREGRCRRQLGLLYLDRHTLDPAYAEIYAAAEMLVVFPPLLPMALAAAARVLVDASQVDLGLDAALNAMSALDRVGNVDEGEAFTRLVFAETLAVSGREAEAQRAIRDARDRLVERAERLPLEIRACFLDDVMENRRTLQLAAEWLGEAPPKPKERPTPRASTPPAAGPAPERPFTKDPPRPERVRTAAGAAPAGKAASPSRPVGLVISSNEPRLELMVSALKELRFGTIRAASGEEALDRLDRLVAAPPHLAIFIDPLTPGLDGQAFVERLRAHAKVGRSRVVIASKAVAAKLRSTAREWGADGSVPLGGETAEVAAAMLPFMKPAG